MTNEELSALDGMTGSNDAASASPDVKKKPGRKPKDKGVVLGLEKPTALADENRIEASRNTARSDRGQERGEERKPNRIPAHERQMLDVYHCTPGFHGHWAADIPGRIDILLAAGYRFKTKDGHVYSQSITENGIDSRISKPGGGGVTLYFMELPLELYEQDQRDKNRKAQEQLLSTLPDDPAFYSRDAHGKEVDSREAARVETHNTAY